MIRRIESRSEELSAAHRYVLVAEWGQARHVPSDAFLKLRAQWSNALGVTVIRAALQGYELEIVFEPLQSGIAAGTILDRFREATRAGLPGIETEPAARRLFQVEDAYVSPLASTGGEQIQAGAERVGRALKFGVGAVGIALLALVAIVVLK